MPAPSEGRTKGEVRHEQRRPPRDMTAGKQFCCVNLLPRGGCAIGLRPRGFAHVLLLIRLLMIERVLQCSTHVCSRIVAILLRRRMLRRRGEMAAGAMPCAGVCCCSVAVAVGAVGVLRRLVIRRLHSHMRIGSAWRHQR